MSAVPPPPSWGKPIAKFPAVGSLVDFSERRGGSLQIIRARVVDDPRNDGTRVAIQPLNLTDTGRKPAVRMRARHRLDPVF